MRSYKEAIIEISGKCNIACKYCTTGINGGKENSKCMSAEEFSKVIEYLLEKEIISADAQISLDSWGEPMLNEELEAILRRLCEKNLHYTISTNGQTYMELPRECLATMEGLHISLPGFSEETYHRVSNGSFEAVIQNIERFVADFTKYGIEKKIKINFLVYQFNMREYYAVKEFCEERNIVFFPHFAYFADYDMFHSCVKKDQNETRMKQGVNDVFTFWYDEYLQKRPEDFRCPQYEILAINENADVYLCCCKTDKVGRLYDLSLSEIRDRKESNTACVECQKSGTDFMIHNMPETQWHFTAKIEHSEEKKVEDCFRLYYDTGNGFNELECQKIKIKESGKLNCYEIDLPAAVKRIRMDPVEGRRCVVENFQLGGVESYVEKFTSDIKVYTGGLMVMESTDPNLVIEMRDPVQHFTIQMKIGVLEN